MISGTTVLFSNMIGPAEPIEFYGHPVAYIAPSNFGHPSVSSSIGTSRFFLSEYHFICRLQ
jgi:hypothetical protein